MAAPNLGQGIDRGNYRRRNGITPPAAQGKAAGAVAETVFFGTATGPVTHATTGALTGQIGSIVGSAARVGGAVTHATTGTLTGQGTSLAGAATRFRAHPTSGLLSGQGSALAGTARHNVPHATSGTLAGQGTTLTGSAARTRAFATSGVLAGQQAAVVGSASRQAAAVTHDTFGELIGPQSIIVGEADPVDPPIGGGGGGSSNAQAVVHNRDRNRNRDPKRGWANERAQLEQSLIDFEQRQRLKDIAQTLDESEQPQARRIARKLADYTGELDQVQSLRRELAKLEAAQQSRALTAERDRDLEAAAAELSEILRDDEDVAGALMALHDHEAKLMLGVLGIAM
jgi:hypothetical protein